MFLYYTINIIVIIIFSYFIIIILSIFDIFAINIFLIRYILYRTRIRYNISSSIPFYHRYRLCYDNSFTRKRK